MLETKAMISGIGIVISFAQTVLAKLAVHLELDRQLAGIGNAGRRRDGRDRGRGVEALGDAPRVAAALGGGLDIAERHVEADAVAEHVAQGVFGADVPPAGADRDHDLDFVMQAQGERRARHHAAVADERRGGLQEEHRGLVPIGTHLARVVAIVAAERP